MLRPARQGLLGTVEEETSAEEEMKEMISFKDFIQGMQYLPIFQGHSRQKSKAKRRNLRQKLSQKVWKDVNEKLHSLRPSHEDMKAKVRAITEKEDESSQRRRFIMDRKSLSALTNLDETDSESVSLGLTEASVKAEKELRLQLVGESIQKQFDEGAAQGATYTAKVLRLLQRQDPECKKIAAQLYRLRVSGSKKNSSPLKYGQFGYFLHDGLLKVTKEGTVGKIRQGFIANLSTDSRVFVPEALREHLIAVYHRSPMLFHPGIEGLKATIRRSYYWPTMDKDIEHGVKGCLGCFRAKTPHTFKKHVHFSLAPATPLSVISLDLYGPLPPDPQGNTYILVIVDNFSRWCVLTPLGGTTQGRVGAREVASAVLTQWIKNHGVPDLIISDKDAKFESEIWADLAKYVGYKKEIAPPDAHWRVSRPERLNRYLNERLRIWKKGSYRYWSDALPFVEMAHRFLVIPRLRMSPFEILMGKPPKLPFATFTGAASIPDSLVGKQVYKAHKQLHDLQTALRDLDRQLQLKRLRRQKAKRSPPLQPGDQAIWLSEGSDHGKLKLLWSDVVQIEQQISPSTYEIRFPNGETLCVAEQSLRYFASEHRDITQSRGPLLDIKERMLHEGESMGQPQNLKLKNLPRESALVSIPEDATALSSKTLTDKLDKEEDSKADLLSLQTTTQQVLEPLITAVPIPSTNTVQAYVILLQNRKVGIVTPQIAGTANFELPCCMTTTSTAAEDIVSYVHKHYGWSLEPTELELFSEQKQKYLGFLAHVPSTALINDIHWISPEELSCLRPLGACLDTNMISIVDWLTRLFKEEDGTPDDDRVGTPFTNSDNLWRQDVKAHHVKLDKRKLRRNLRRTPISLDLQLSEPPSAPTATIIEEQPNAHGKLSAEGIITPLRIREPNRDLRHGDFWTYHTPGKGWELGLYVSHASRPAAQPGWCMLWDIRASEKSLLRAQELHHGKEIHFTRSVWIGYQRGQLQRVYGSTTDGLDHPPKDRHVRDLTPEWIEVEKAKLICPVRLGSEGQILQYPRFRDKLDVWSYGGFKRLKRPRNKKTINRPIKTTTVTPGSRQGLRPRNILGQVRSKR